MILLDHIRCAAFELPFRDGELFGDVDPTVYLELLAEDGVLHPDSGRWEWIADSYPAIAVSLRSVADGNFVVVDRTDGRQTIIAEVDFSSAPLMLYERAIHMVQSTPFQVEHLDWEGRKAFVTRTWVDYYTDAIDYTKLKVLERFDGCIAGRGGCHHGEVHVVRRVSGYKKIRYYTHENIGYGPVNLPDQEMHTSAVWWQLPQHVLEELLPSRQDQLDGFLAAAYALHVVAKVAVMADAVDLQKAVGSGDGAWFAQADGRGRGQLRTMEGGLLDPAKADSFVPTVFLYDNYPGGVGLSEPLWRRQAELVRKAQELVEACDCKAGCPACVGPAFDTGKGPTPRALATRVLVALQAQA